MIKYDLYAFVTDDGWRTGLIEKWPDAPIYGGYRLLVATATDFPKFEKEYSDVKFKHLLPTEVIQQMEMGNDGPFICDIYQAHEVVNHFSSDIIS